MMNDVTLSKGDPVTYTGFRFDLLNKTGTIVDVELWDGKFGRIKGKVAKVQFDYTDKPDGLYYLLPEELTYGQIVLYLGG